MNILRQPWVHLKRWIEAHSKRKRREWKLQTALARMSAMGGMGGMFGSASAEPKEMSDEERVTAMQAAGFAVTQKRE